MAKKHKFRLRNDSLGVFLPMHESASKEDLIALAESLEMLFGHRYSIHYNNQEVWNNGLQQARDS